MLSALLTVKSIKNFMWQLTAVRMNPMYMKAARYMHWIWYPFEVYVRRAKRAKVSSRFVFYIPWLVTIYRGKQAKEPELIWLTSFVRTKRLLPLMLPLHEHAFSSEYSKYVNIRWTIVLFGVQYNWSKFDI